MDVSWTIKKLSTKELMILNWGVEEDSWESLGLQGDKIVKEISPEYSLEGLMLKLKLQYWLIWKDPDAGKDWRQEEKGRTEDEMVGWDHRLSGHDCEQAPGVGDGQGSLACCSPWAHKELDTTERLNWTDWETSWQNLVTQVSSQRGLLSHPVQFPLGRGCHVSRQDHPPCFQQLLPYQQSLQTWWVLKLKEVDQSSCLKPHHSFDIHPSSGSHASSISPLPSFPAPWN